MNVKSRLASLVICCLVFMFEAAGSDKPALQLATPFTKEINVKDYFVSEKLDGIRGYWDGRQLSSKGGYSINAPRWFLRQMPNAEVDGELWIARGQFEQISSIVASELVDDSHWQNVHFKIFDLHDASLTFEQRLNQLKKLIPKNAKNVSLIEQFSVDSIDDLYRVLDDYLSQGAEGLMLHLKKAKYVSGRSGNVIKLKRYQDAEAIVIGYIPGKGKYKGMLGALLVRNAQGVEFRLGTGFSDEERIEPPLIGSVVTYKYLGYTINNKPKFASFLRVRTDSKIN